MDPFESELDLVISRSQQMSWDDLSCQLVVDPEKAHKKSPNTLNGGLVSKRMQYTKPAVIAATT